jgi:phosphoribosylformylglycinamidine synthase
VTLRDYPDATLPVISGNVSLYNNTADGAIPPSPMISCLGVMPDVSAVTTYALKSVSSVLLMVGERKDECGGSIYYQLKGELGANVPKPDLSALASEVSAMYAAIQQKLILSAHDISEGGVAVALAEMSFANNIGVNVTIPGELSNTKKLFGESGGFILEVERHKLSLVQKLFAEHHVPLFEIGNTTNNATLRMNNIVSVAVNEAKHAWGNGLRDRLL